MSCPLPPPLSPLCSCRTKVKQCLKRRGILHLEHCFFLRVKDTKVLIMICDRQVPNNSRSFTLWEVRSPETLNKCLRTENLSRVNVMMPNIPAAGHSPGHRVRIPTQNQCAPASPQVAKGREPAPWESGVGARSCSQEKIL